MTLFSIGAIILNSGAAGCMRRTAEDHEGEKNMPTKTIEEVLDEYTDEWMSIPGVVGTAQGLDDGKPCIKVYVIEKTPEIDRTIPKVLHGHPVVVEQTGEIRALPKKQD